jgi:CcmD family protein
MEGIEYLGAAYIILWVVLTLYIFGLSRKQKQISGDLEDLKKEVNKLA